MLSVSVAVLIKSQTMTNYLRPLRQPHMSRGFRMHLQHCFIKTMPHSLKPNALFGARCLLMLLQHVFKNPFFIKAITQTMKDVFGVAVCLIHLHLVQQVGLFYDFALTKTQINKTHCVMVCSYWDYVLSVMHKVCLSHHTSYSVTSMQNSGISQGQMG